MYYLLLFHCNDSYANVPNCYVTRTLPILFVFTRDKDVFVLCISYKQRPYSGLKAYTKHPSRCVQSIFRCPDKGSCREPRKQTDSLSISDTQQNLCVVYSVHCDVLKLGTLSWAFVGVTVVLLIQQDFGITTQTNNIPNQRAQIMPLVENRGTYSITCFNDVLCFMLLSR